MKIYLNQVFRATDDKRIGLDIEKDERGFVYYKHATSNNQEKKTGANISRPMFWYKDIKLNDDNEICPAFICHSNPFQQDEAVNPWRDVILQNEGVAYYNGDNKRPGVAPNHVPYRKPQTGNSKLESLIQLYFSQNKETRAKAPPILVFEQEKVDNITKGYRKFIGLGIITHCDIRQQYDENNQVFSNYLFEITLISLDDGKFEFGWINDRRNKELSIMQVNEKAPEKWKKWVRNGTESINSVRQKILKSSASNPIEQIDELDAKHKSLLNKIVRHYENRRKDKFEALASLAAKEFFGVRYTVGWITQSTGDMGVDFVGRYDVEHSEINSLPGDILGKTSLLVVGQAKCRSRFDDKDTAEKTIDIARVSSRLKRGSIGIYVTTGTYKKSTQKEVYIDALPIILINGRLLADLIIRYMLYTGKNIEKIMAECDKWYDENQKNISPSNILHADIGD